MSPRRARAARRASGLALPALVACATTNPGITRDAGTYPWTDARAGENHDGVYEFCPPTGRGCDLPPGLYVPVIAGEAAVVWQPSGGRYTNEPSLVHDDAAGIWHVFANSSTGPGDPWAETRLVHAQAPSLMGPWTELPDALAAQDPGALERQVWAPFALRDGAGYRVLYAGQSLAGVDETHSAVTRDFVQFDRDPVHPFPGKRDAMILRLSDGRDLIYSTAVRTEPDGVHDAVAVYVGHALGDWGPEQTALRDARVCPAGCWGWYESPYVVEVGGYYFLFTTHTDSGAATYERTDVYRSSDPLHFEEPPLTTLQAHGAELHVENNRMYMTRGGWPRYITEARRGLSVVPISWVRE